MSVWRVGRSQLRTLYRDDKLVGLVDTPEIASQIVAALHAWGGAPDRPAFMAGYSEIAEPEDVKWSRQLYYLYEDGRRDLSLRHVGQKRSGSFGLTLCGKSATRMLTKSAYELFEPCSQCARVHARNPKLKAPDDGGVVPPEKGGQSETHYAWSSKVRHVVQHYNERTTLCGKSTGALMDDPDPETKTKACAMCTRALSRNPQLKSPKRPRFK